MEEEKLIFYTIMQCIFSRILELINKNIISSGSSRQSPRAESLQAVQNH